MEYHTPPLIQLIVPLRTLFSQNACVKSFLVLVVFYPLSKYNHEMKFLKSLYFTVSISLCLFIGADIHVRSDPTPLSFLSGHPCPLSLDLRSLLAFQFTGAFAIQDNIGIVKSLVSSLNLDIVLIT